ncbi:MAG TPA: hypothetical protein VJR30_12250 [Bradyrhizobium sp.]|nr:hypothetical protein [Bradyrhizobium sp.]
MQANATAGHRTRQRLLLAAVDIPDDIRQERVEIDIPSLSLARLLDEYAKLRQSGQMTSGDGS